jgi:predicted transcriptional regulator
MCKILLSINPKHVENIFNGTKKYEFRKIRCKENIDKIIIYSTAPIMKVVGEAAVEEVLEGSPADVWQKTKKNSGINKSFYQKYYNGREKAIAYKLKDIVKYESPRELSYYGVKAAPQSFVYIS